MSKYPYKQMVEQCHHFYRYEYWWVHIPETVGVRMIKVHIPPSKYPQLQWQCIMIDGGADEPFHNKQEVDEWEWLEIIKEPNHKSSNLTKEYWYG